MSRTRPLFVRPLTDAERQVLQDSLRATDAFVLRRAQIVLASAAGERSGQIPHASASRRRACAM